MASEIKLKIRVMIEALLLDNAGLRRDEISLLVGEALNVTAEMVDEVLEKMLSEGLISIGEMDSLRKIKFYLVADYVNQRRLPAKKRRNSQLRGKAVSPIAWSVNQLQKAGVA